MRYALPISGLLLLGLGPGACDGPAELPDPGSDAYAESVAELHAGTAALQAGEAGLAEASFRRVTELAAGEPAGWANLALTAVGRGQVDAAADAVGRALALAPEHGRIRLIAALVAMQQDRSAEARDHLRSALEHDPDNLRAAFLLAQLVERQGGAGAAAEASRLMDRILSVAPSNLVALVERGRLGAEQGLGVEVVDVLDRLGAEELVRDAAAPTLEAARRAVEAGDLDQAARQLTILQSELQRVPAYRDDRDRVRVAAGGTSAILHRFLRLPMPAVRTAAPDPDVTFTPESLSVGGGSWDWVRALWLGDEVPMAVFGANPERFAIGITPEQVERIEFPGGGASRPLPPAAMAFLDYDYDFRTDLALAGAGGLRLLRQAGIGTFDDVTDAALPPGVATGRYAAVWAADLDMEGDMDLVVARESGPPLILWNLGDERFEAGEELQSVDGLRDFVWADLDADGDPDAAVLDARGSLHVFDNRRFRSPRFEAIPTPGSPGGVQALATADLDRDAVLDLVMLRDDGAVVQLSRTADGGWTTTELARWDGFSAQPVGLARLFLADLDNNGDLDLVASSPAGTRTWLSTADGLHEWTTLDVWITDVADLSGEGRLDLVGRDRDGTPRLFTNQGSRDYYSTLIHPRAARVAGDRRINSFGVGGEIEIRAGLLYQKQPITGSMVHFGLGDHGEVDVARIIWPNGTVQAEFDLPATNEAVTALQRLKGSCPWVYAYNGREMEFVTDFLWRTALGLRINAQGDASVIHAEDWIRVRGDQLAPRDGFYDVRITGELWESHFFDQVQLMAVDHPEGTEVFVDERFTLPAPEPAVHLMGPLRPIEGATDQDGRDVTERVARLDERYLDTFELGPYQGLAEDHYVEVTLGPATAPGEPVWLVASGWVYPTDGSINFALAQAGRPGPRGVRVQVPDGRGGWAVVEADYGFPAGKTKTILIDLTDAFPQGAERRVRLGTNMEVYWDRIAWANGRPDTDLRTTRLPAATAELRYRGFSEVHAAGRRAPELPDYGSIAAVTPQWRDLVGYHTRFGPVAPLIEAVDDRYVIMNAGDELALRFPAPPPPPDGWTRDFVLVGDGWVKDGDYNNGFSRTVMPLPYHGLEDYDTPPGRLEDDPAYRRHPEDWENYHTRYVTPQPFQQGLVPPGAGR